MTIIIIIINYIIIKTKAADVVSHDGTIRERGRPTWESGPAANEEERARIIIIIITVPAAAADDDDDDVPTTFSGGGGGRRAIVPGRATLTPRHCCPLSGGVVPRVETRSR